MLYLDVDRLVPMGGAIQLSTLAGINPAAVFVEVLIVLVLQNENVGHSRHRLVTECVPKAGYALRCGLDYSIQMRAGSNKR